MPSPDGYSLRDYGAMIANRPRLAAYEAALRKAVRPGAVVLDLGAGTGIMSLLACRLGASRVYAVETGAALVVAAELARANGWADRIEFLNKSSFDVTLERQADVVVSDLRGTLPLHGRHIPAIQDVRRRLLAPGGALIPLRDHVWLQPISDAGLYGEFLGVWRDGVCGVDLSAALKWAAHALGKCDVSKSRRIGQPQRLATLDYPTLRSPDVAGKAAWSIEAACEIHGIAAWFSSVLADGVELSSAPDQSRLVYGQMFFPLPEALVLGSGDSITVEMSAQLLDDNYVWRWHTLAARADGTRRQWRQSSFEAEPANPDRLKRRSPGHAAAIGDRGRATREALGLMEQGMSVGHIAAALERAYPKLFAPGALRAHDFVGDLVERYSA